MTFPVRGMGCRGESVFQAYAALGEMYVRPLCRLPSVGSDDLIVKSAGQLTVRSACMRKWVADKDGAIASRLMAVGGE